MTSKVFVIVFVAYRINEFDIFSVIFVFYLYIVRLCHTYLASCMN